MAFFRKFSKKGQAVDKTDTPVEEMRSHFHISQLEVPPKAYTYREGRPTPRNSIGESLLQTVDNLSTNKPVSPGVSIFLVSIFIRRDTRNITNLLSQEPPSYQERRYREKIANLVEENDRLRVENAELKSNLEKESDKHMTTLEYWVKAEEQLGELLRACQTRHDGRWGHSDYYEENNDVGDIGGESESTDEGDFNSVVKP